jgi:Lon protease-like protein
VEAIPLFPLGTVLFPGVMLPLHVFEPRYRELMRHLMEQPAGAAREFGVVGVRPGWDSADGREAMYEVGCTAELREVRSYPDGSLDVVAAGRRRFRLHVVDHSVAAYPHAKVAWLPEANNHDDEASVLARSVGEVFGHYLRLLAGEPDQDRVLPTDPLTLSHLIAASAPLSQDDRQELLAETRTLHRLRRELRLLKREAAMLRRIRAVPVPLAELRVPTSMN